MNLAVLTPIGEAAVSLGVASYPESVVSAAERVYGAQTACTGDFCHRRRAGVRADAAAESGRQVDLQQPRRAYQSAPWFSPRS